ncbi:MAG TPA: VOC family protein [Acidimicrobiales bacterium]|nr:VOC family protein [Acidimicrobiales bacterium]
MTTRDRAPVGAPVWLELSTSDVDRALPFYRSVFGWDVEGPNPDMGGYFNFIRHGERIAGGMASQPGGAANTWAVYLASDDARKTVEVAGSNGAQVLVPAMDVMDLGVMAVLLDPTGVATGVWQPGTHPGFRTTGEPGAPGWFELHTRDFQGSLDFYGQVFGWETQTISDTDEFRYAVLSIDGQQVAGVADDGPHLPAGESPFWRVYFWSADTDETLEKITAAGGQIRRPAEDTPYGRLAEAADPTGTVFSVMAANAAMPAN